MGEAKRRALYRLRGKDLRYIEWGKAALNTVIETTIIAERYAFRARYPQDKKHGV